MGINTNAHSKQQTLLPIINYWLLVCVWHCTSICKLLWTNNAPLCAFCAERCDLIFHYSTLRLYFKESLQSQSFSRLKQRKQPSEQQQYETGPHYSWIFRNLMMTVYADTYTYLHSVCVSSIFRIIVILFCHPLWRFSFLFSISSPHSLSYVSVCVHCMSFAFSSAVYYGVCVIHYMCAFVC